MGSMMASHEVNSNTYWGAAPFIVMDKSNLEEDESPDLEGAENLAKQHLYEQAIEFDTVLSVEQVVHALQTSGHAYDPSAVRRIAAAIAPSPNGVFTANAFVAAYKKRISELHTFIQSRQSEVHYVEQLLSIAEGNLRGAITEQASPNPEPSQLVVQLVSVQLPNRHNEGAQRVVLECQNQIIESVSAFPSDSVLYYNEVFSFDIAAGMGDLQVKLVKSAMPNEPEETRGQCCLPLASLAHQQKEDVELFVKATDDGLVGTVLVSAQWVYSKRSLYEKHVTDLRKKHQRKSDSLLEYSRELRIMNAPFSSQRKRSSGMMGIVDVCTDHMSRRIDSILAYAQLDSWPLALQYSFISLLFLTSLAGFARSLYLDQAIGAFAWWCHIDEKNRWTKVRYSVIIFLCLVSICFDFFWLQLNLDTSQGESHHRDLLSVSQIFSIFIILWKVLLIAFLWKQRQLATASEDEKP